MTDFRHGFQPLDRGRIQAGDPVEFAFWCRKPRCSELPLQPLVQRVGRRVRQVREAAGQSPAVAPPAARR